MWSTGLIVGVALPASLVLFIVGAFLAVSIERRRYRMYTKRHFAGISFAADREKQPKSNDFDDDWESRISLDNGLDNVTLPYIKEMSTTSSSYTAEEAPARKKSVSGRLKGAKRKKKSHRRKLKKIPRTKHEPSSPLSAISEQDEYQDIVPDSMPQRALPVSSTPYVSVDVIAISGQSPDTNLSISPVQNALHTQHTHLASEPSVAALTKSKSMASSVSIAPDEPLPALPPTSFNRVSHLRSSARRLTPSMESISSSVLQIPCQTSDHAVSSYRTSETPTLDCSEHDTARTRLKRRSRVIPHVTSRPTSFEAGTLHANSRSTADLRRKRSTILTLCSYEQADDPFVTTSASRSIDHGIPLQNMVIQAQPHLKMLSMKQDFDKRNTFSGLPSTTVPYRLERLDYHAKQTVQERSITSNGRDRSRSPAPMNHDTFMASTTLKSKMTGERDETRASFGVLSWKNGLSLLLNSSTPDSISKARWNLNCDLPESPLCLPSSPLRSYYSPILPSPAYTPANLYSRPRRSKVRGPRSPPHPARSPLRPKEDPKTYHDNLSAPKLFINHIENVHSRLSIMSSLSSHSGDGLSIWEDESVKEDTPEFVPPISGDGDSFPPETPNKTMEDYEMYEQFENDVDQQGLGLNLRISVAPTTPWSMYDESGFLKE